MYKFSINYGIYFKLIYKILFDIIYSCFKLKYSHLIEYYDKLK